MRRIYRRLCLDVCRILAFSAPAHLYPDNLPVYAKHDDTTGT